MADAVAREQPVHFLSGLRPRQEATLHPGLVCAIDVGSTTCKYVLCRPGLQTIAEGYDRHHTRQGSHVQQILERLEAECDFRAGRDRLYMTGSGAGKLAELLGGRLVQEVVAVAAAVERLHPSARFVSEIGGEDMKTIFFAEPGTAGTRQVFMQSACSGGTGTFIEKTARKLGIDAQALATMPYHGRTLHPISSKCGIFAESDANALVKAGIPIEDIVASLFEAVVVQNLAVLARGNTPLPQTILLGGPNQFYAGLRDAWSHNLSRLWTERQVSSHCDDPSLAPIEVPQRALYYAALGCVVLAASEPAAHGSYRGLGRLRTWLDTDQKTEKLAQGAPGLSTSAQELATFRHDYRTGHAARARPPSASQGEPLALGCDFGSTTVKAVALDPTGEVVRSWYSPSEGNPIDDARTLFKQIGNEIASHPVCALGVTGYGKDLMTSILGADLAVVETIAHATAGLHFFADADCICDVGGIDTKIMLLRQGTVSDFRLNSQCSSGNGAFLQGVAERFGIALGDIADLAFAATAMPRLSMGCGVFLQSDIVNQQRKGWQAEEILAGLCATLPLNVWVYAAGLHNLRSVGRKFILQGGTHRNLAVVKAQRDYIVSQVPEAEVVLHPYSGEAGAIGAAMAAARRMKGGAPSAFRGFSAIAQLEYASTTSAATVCQWCSVHCQRTFIDVRMSEAAGRPWSRVPLPSGNARLIVNNSCAKGLVEDKAELKVIRSEIDKTRQAFPNVADRVRSHGFRAPRQG